ncbi:hypothetical protein GLOTRDRAFT_137801 [Gloeophyllum trabeum ATCC 11539]|uniref:F-box domain-containing protein n=1 Tax=Gloeophyllum trabeum (strain ATCC 11539 / FP-39264 / Madison 617) TaxID=670483 RepID=S7RS97_GLOTA|nr:uncharacterized protein GLOTRDRAFT_137801 [Gloeophyllum trabeum ATCC 11539]EPQ57480.1 hypothetical protein GLOTRDRAFT_137801 [Gloeophyllum trabeum ATCC 11539]
MGAGVVEQLSTVDIPPGASIHACPRLLSLMQSRPPYLYLHQAEEVSLLRGKYIHEPLDDVTREKLCRYESFRWLDIIEGFHKGSLDLAGRHFSRYLPLQNLWRAFRKELMDVQQKRPSRGQENGTLESKVEAVVLRDEPDAESLQELRQKWSIASTITYEELLGKAAAIDYVMSVQPMPILQRRRLMFLPVELLDAIMGIAEVRDARFFSATCRLLRRISLKYIYTELIFICRMFPPEDGEFLDRLRAHKADIQSQLLPQRDRFMARLDFVKSRRDILDNMSKICIMDQWMTCPEALEEVGVVDIVRPLDATICTAIGGFLQAATSLTSLFLWQITLDPAIFQAVAAMPRLRTVHYNMCGLEFDPRWLVRHARSTSVVNLALVVNSETGWTMWNVLPLYPQARVCTICPNPGPLHNPLFLPEDVVQDSHAVAFFASVERLFIDSFDIPDAFTLPTLFGLAATTGNGLRLTHFKLHAVYGMNRNQIIELLTALSSAPLEVLILEGVQYAEPDLFELISNVFPNLIALTVCYRPNDFHPTGEIKWPCPSWEYAPHLRRFHRLQHLGMNLKHDIEYSPRDMLSVEEEYETLPEWDEDALDDNDWTIARTFSVSCPSLKTFLFVPGPRSSNFGIEITRNGSESLFTGKFDSHLPIKDFNPRYHDILFNTMCSWEDRDDKQGYMTGKEFTH